MCISMFLTKTAVVGLNENARVLTEAQALLSAIRTVSETGLEQ